MAHGPDKQAAIRAAYVHERLPLEQAALRAGVPMATAARWKRQAKKNGEDWDALRGACLLAGEGIEAIGRQMLSDYVVQHQAMMAEISSEKVTAAQKVSMLASLADSFNKTVAASRRILPETNELAVALEVLNLMGDYLRDHHPPLVADFVDVLDGFGAELSRHYSAKRAG